MTGIFQFQLKHFNIISFSGIKQLYQHNKALGTSYSFATYASGL